MAATFSSRVHRLGYSFSNHVLYQKVDVRGYARIFHRNPIKVLTTEEAEKVNKPTLYYEEPPTNRRKIGQSQPPQHVKFAEQTNNRFNNNTSPSFNLSRNSFIEEGTWEEKRSKDTTKSSFVDSKKTLSRKGAKFLIKSGSYDKSTLDIGGEKLEVITDKIIAERKLRYCYYYILFQYC